MESQARDFHAEINATENAQLFQEFLVQEGDLISYSIWHRGRAGLDVANVVIGPPGNQTIQQELATGNQAWANYTGQYTVPSGVSVLQIGFDAVSTANGNLSVGNFIDNLEVSVSR